MRLVTAILLTLLLSNISKAQENYIPGVITLSNGTEINGFIDYRNWSRNPDKILAKREFTSEPEEFLPQDISGFSVGEDRYVSALVDREVSSLITRKLDFSSEPDLVRETLFLLVLIEGDKSLYKYLDDTDRYNYYIETDGEIELLIYKKYLDDSGGDKREGVNTKYIGQLIYYLRDCNDISSKSATMRYNERTLRKLYDHYYDCVNAEPEYIKSVEKIKHTIGIVGGAVVSSIRFKSSDEYFTYLSEGVANKPLGATFGINLRSTFPRNFGRLSLQNEFLLTNSSFEINHLDYVHELNFVETKTRLENMYLKFSHQVRLRFPLKGMHFFFGPGVAVGLSVTETNLREERTVLQLVDRTTESAGLPSTAIAEGAFLLVTGISKGRLSLEVRFEIGTGMSDLVYLQTQTRRIHSLIGYRF